VHALLLLLLLLQFSFVATTTVEAPDSMGNSSSSFIMVMVDQLGRLAQFPVDADGRVLQKAAYNPFDGSSQWNAAELSQRPSCAGVSAAGAGSSTEL
jgi:hypothetical protein